MSNNKVVGIGLFVALVAGVMLGRLGTGTPETVTKTVYKDKPVVTSTTVNHVPEACTRALDMAVTVRDAAGKFDTVSGPQLDLMDKVGQAISGKSIKELNDLITKQRKLRADTQDAANTLQGELFVYGQILTKCKKELGQR